MTAPLSTPQQKIIRAAHRLTEAGHETFSHRDIMRTAFPFQKGHEGMSRMRSISSLVAKGELVPVVDTDWVTSSPHLSEHARRVMLSTSSTPEDLMAVGRVGMYDYRLPTTKETQP